MGLSRMAVKRPVATATILILILLIGAVSLYQSPLDLLPDIQPPVLAVITSFPGSSPQETLDLVTRRIEGEVAAISGITGISSVSQESISLVILQFDWGMDVKDVRDNVSTRLELIDFPDDVQQPMLLEFDPTLMPIMMVAASGGENRVDLTEWLEDTVSPRLESIPGMASVQVQGGARQDVFVRTSPDLMNEYGVSFDQISNIIRASLVDLPAGIIDLDEQQVRIRFLGRYAESEMLSDLVVGFQTDEDELERMIGEEINVDLNQVLSSGEAVPGGGGGFSNVPMREIYWDDIFNFAGGDIVGSELFIPVNNDWAAEQGGDVADSLRLFTANPHITYDPATRQMALSLDSLGQRTLTETDGGMFLTGGDSVRLEDIWLVSYGDWDGNRAIIPLDPGAISRYGLSEADIARLANDSSLITDANSRYILVTFHENWEELRREPAVQFPDYNEWLANISRDIDRGIDDTSRLLEEGLRDLAGASIQGSMVSGGTGMAGFDFDDDFPIIPVSLEMLAEIEQDTHNPSTITRYNMQPSIGMMLQKEGDANTVQVARDLRGALDELSEESRGNFSQVDFNITMDQAEEIERALTDLAHSLGGGAILAIIVLILFLKNWRTTMFIALSIPAAIIATFTLLYFADFTINLMTLGGLALAAGMLVDNSIVVSENIYRRYQLGENPDQAAIEGAREVSGAITASTLTTISVFFPVVFLTGLAGQLFWEFALTVACAILASLLVAMTVIPLLASRSLRRQRKSRSENGGVPRLPTYRRLLKLAVNHPWWVIIFALLIVAAGAFGFTTLGSELFPMPDESAFNIDITLPPGTTMEQTDSYAREVEHILDGKTGVESFNTRIGSGGFMGMGGGSGASNLASIRVDVDPAQMSEMDNIIEAVRQQVEELNQETEVVFSRESLLDSAGLETTLDLTISGDDLEKVTEISQEAVALLSGHENFPDVQSSLEENRPEVHIRLDQGVALQSGITQLQVAGMVRQALEGIPVSRIETDGGILDVILGYKQDEIRTVEDIGRLGFYTPNGEYLHLEDIAEISEGFGPESIPREDQKIVSELEIRYEGIDLGGATDLALAELEALSLPEGYEIKPAGSFALMEEVLSELELVLLMAALLVYLVMAAQFESLLHPFIIILTLPMAFAGAIIALVITGSSISVPAMIGLVVLAGILVNDGIIMVDYINQLRRIHGYRLKEAIIEGAAVRLRPIMMLTATTGLGLLPLALGFGEGSQLQAPMAITIIGGQITGTVLLLLAIPSLYIVVTKDKGSGPGVLDVSEIGGKPDLSSNKTWHGNNKSSGKPENPLMKVLFRLVIVSLLLAIILILYSLYGLEPAAVVQNIIQ